MAVVAHTEADIKRLARLARAEEVPLGMLMVGNAGVNKGRGYC